MGDCRPDDTLGQSPASLLPLDALDRTEALYSLEIQKHRHLIQRLRQQQQRPESHSKVDFVIRPRRAA